MKQVARAIIIRNDTLLAMKRNKFGDEYYCLIGGGVDMGETPEEALVREVKEEAGLDVTSYRLVFIEDAGAPYGMQYIYLCDDPGGEIALSSDTIEAELNKIGQNLYEPVWLAIKDLETVVFRSERLRRAIIKALDTTFPIEVEKL